MAENYTEINFNRLMWQPSGLIQKRIFNAFETSLIDISNVFGWDNITLEEAWRLVSSMVTGWDKYKDNRTSFPGGLIELGIKSSPTGLVAVAFVGLKDFDRPRGWNTGAIGSDRGVIMLGPFPHKIK